MSSTIKELTQTANTQAKMTPAEALQMLKEGNQRFFERQVLDRNLLKQVAITAMGQFPYAVVLSCIDSRVPAELVFDTGIGDIFSVRIAGNFVNDDILGSMEFACKLAGSKLVLVLGHTKCGAVQGACNNAELGHLTDALKKLKPAVQAVKKEGQYEGDELYHQVAVKNVELVKEQIPRESEVLRELEEQGEIAIVGALYDVETGKVMFMND